MEDTQKFQTPFQLALLRIHAVIEKVVAPIERFFVWLNPNNGQFIEYNQSKPQLRAVK